MIIVEVTMICDRCGADSIEGDSIDDVKKKARIYGWKVIEGLYLCFGCKVDVRASKRNRVKNTGTA